MKKLTGWKRGQNTARRLPSPQLRMIGLVDSQTQLQHFHVQIRSIFHG